MGDGACCDDVKVYNLVDILIPLVFEEGGLSQDDART